MGELTLNKISKGLLLDKEESGLILDGRVGINLAATVDFTVDIANPREFETVTFTANVVGLVPEFYVWDFGDGVIQASTTNIIQHKYASGGLKSVQAFASNDDIGTAITQKDDFVDVIPFDPTFGATRALEDWIDIWDVSKLTLVGGTQISAIQDKVDSLRIYQAASPANNLTYFRPVGSADIPISYVAQSAINIQFLKCPIAPNPGAEFRATINQPFHIFLLWKSISFSNAYPFAGAATNNEFFRYVNVNNVRLRTSISNANSPLTSVLSLGVFVTFEITRDAAGNIEFFQNEISLGTDVGRTGNFGTGAFGNRGTAGSNFLREFVDRKIYSEILTGQDLADVRQNYRDRLNHY